MGIIFKKPLVINEIAPAVLAAIIGGASLVGSSALTAFGSGGGGTQGGLHQDDWILWEKNKNLQKEFAQNGIQWKVDDAKRSGIHPLAALGAQTSQFSPVQVGSGQGYKGVSKTDRIAKFLADSGQDISRSVRALQTKQQRELTDIVLAQEKAKLKGFELENQVLEKRLNGPNANSFPTSGLGIVESDLTPDVDSVPGKVYQVVPEAVSSAPGVKLGTGPEGGYKHSRMGYIKYYPDQNVMDLLSESMPAAFSWWSDMLKYKYVMTAGRAAEHNLKNGEKLSKTDQKHYKFYISEKNKMKKHAGAPVYWDSDNINGFKWRLESFRHK